MNVVPSREEPWSQSALLALGLGVAVVGTAVDGLAHTLGGGRGVLVPPEDPRTLAGALSRVLAGERPDPALGRACARQFTPSAAAAVYASAYRQLLAAAPEPGSQARHGLETSAFWCRSWSWAAVLTEMAAPTGRQVTALPHGFRENDRTGPGNIRF